MFETNPQRGGNKSAAPQLLYMKCTVVAPGGNQNLIQCVLVTADGYTSGTTPHTVKSIFHHLVGDKLYVFRPPGGTPYTYNGQRVQYIEFPLLIGPSNKGKYLQVLDDAGNYGFDWPRFV